MSSNANIMLYESAAVHLALVSLNVCSIFTLLHENFVKLGCGGDGYKSALNPAETWGGTLCRQFYEALAS